MPANLGALVMQLVAKDPAWRPGSAAEAAPDCGPSVTIGGGPLATRWNKASRRRDIWRR